MRKLVQSIHHYCKKVKRARNIKRAKDKIAPYLKKDYGVELNYKLWITKGARFVASERNSDLERLSSKTVGYLSAYLIIVNLIHVYNIPYLEILSLVEVGFVTAALSILILIYSQFENANKYSLKADRFHQCGLEIGELYNDLRMAKTFSNISDRETEIRRISEKYDAVLKKYENHDSIDLKMFETAKPPYFELSRLGVRRIKAEKYFKVKFRYHLMIYGPFILFAVVKLYQMYGI
ncbi:SLATT domain-containing protein [Sunxiuqinia indica]|uniref:SLATT domain-containing protein n=1 Tax=Sunxiuqinia indica TaxID=2692584 RepID=UPI00135B7035|nr:SLATT domain-containing protein [Sunxiuqinia indica]